MKLLFLKTGSVASAFLFLFFCSSCDGNRPMNKQAADNSAVSSPSDTMMPAESTTVAATPRDIQTLQAKDATKDSPGVKVDVHKGKFTLRDTTQK